MSEALVPSPAAPRLLLWAALLCAATGAAAGAAEPLTLRRAAELALTRAPELASAEAASEAAAAAERAAEDAFHPQAYLTTTPGYASGLPVAVAGRLPALASVEVRQSLYDPARRADALEARSAAARAQGAARAARVGAVRAVAALYARCRLDGTLAADAKRREEARGRDLDRTRALREQGRATDLDVERAALERARSRQARLDAESDRDLDVLELRRTIGWPANLALTLADDPLASLAPPGARDDLETALQADPELRALQEAGDSLGRAARLREKTVAPIVEAGAEYARLARYTGYDRFYRAFEADDWSFGVSIAIPVLTGGRAADAAAHVRADLDGLAAQRRTREAAVELLTRRAEAQVERGAARVSLAQRAVGVAQEGARVALALAGEGRGEPGGVEASETALADAEDGLARAEVELFSARTDLLALRGELVETLLARRGDGGAGLAVEEVP